MEVVPKKFYLTKYRVGKLLETSIKYPEKRAVEGVKELFIRYLRQEEPKEPYSGKIRNCSGFSRMQEHLPSKGFYETCPCLLSYNNVAVCYEQDDHVVIRHLTPDEYCRLQGFPDGWDSDLGADVHTRWFMWGLGVTLPVIDFIFKGIVKNEKEKEND